MHNRPIRALPIAPTSDNWPHITPTTEDRAWRPTPLSLRDLRRRLKLPSRSLVRRDIVEAIPKGAVIGVAAFALVFGPLPHWHDWSLTWQWAIPVAGTAGLALLLGADSVLAIGGVGAIWAARFAAIDHPTELIGLVLCGIIMRCLPELLP